MAETRDSYDIVGEAVVEYWKANYPCDVIAFFYQKYEHEKNLEWCEELVHSCSSMNYDLEFASDFCEGQTCVSSINIVPLSDVTEFYTKKHFMSVSPKEGDGND